MDIPRDVEAAGPQAVEIYVQSVSKGTAPSLAEMFALRASPRCMTDSVYFEGIGTLEKQFEGDPIGLENVIRRAKKRGYTPNPNDHYNPFLADDIGDPKAFVPPTGARDYIRKHCEDRGLPCEGAVTVKGREPEKDPLEK